MPHIFISAVALCANLYRCAPLIVGDKYADPEIMQFLGAKITTDYPEPNSPPMYVMFATLRSVLDALQEQGFALITAQVVQGYYTWIMSKPFEEDNQTLKTEESTVSASDADNKKGRKEDKQPRREGSKKSVNKEDSTLSQNIESEPEVGSAPSKKRKSPRKKDVAVNTDDAWVGPCFERAGKTDSDIRGSQRVLLNETSLTRASRSQRSLVRSDIKPENLPSYQRLLNKTPSDASKQEAPRGVSSTHSIGGAKSASDAEKPAEPERLPKIESVDTEPASSQTSMQKATNPVSDPAKATSSASDTTSASTKQHGDNPDSAHKKHTRHVGIHHSKPGGRHSGSSAVKDNFKK